MDFQSRKTAKLIVAVVFIVSAVASSLIQLNQFQGQVKNAYYQEDGVYEYLTDKAKVADNLVVIASRNNVNSEAVSRAVVSLNSASIQEAQTINDKLDEAFNQMISDLDNQPLNETDEAYLDKLNTDFKAAQDRLERCNYFTKTAEVKKEVSKFPASLIAKLLGFDLEIY